MPLPHSIPLLPSPCLSIPDLASPSRATLEEMVAIASRVQGADPPVGSVLGKAWSLLPLFLQSAELKRGQMLGSPFTCFPASLGQKTGWWEDTGNLATASFQQCLILNHSQDRNIRCFQSSVFCAEQTSGQSPWPACSTITASHHATKVSERRNGGQVHFSPQQHIFQGSPIKLTCQGHEEKLS